MSDRGHGPGVLLEWDSGFWGITVGRVEGDELTDERRAEVDAWAEAHGVECLYFLARPDDPETVRVAHDAGFRLVDVRVELSRATAEPAGPTLRIRGYRPEDRDPLREIARASYDGTRFYADPRFPRAKCDELYDVWISRSCDGWADAVLVAEQEGRVAGYVTCHLDRAARRGAIGLIAVSARARGRGLGHELVVAAVDRCRDDGVAEVAVVTQGANVAAQRVFQDCGFRSSSTGLWFHRWYGR